MKKKQNIFFFDSWVGKSPEFVNFSLKTKMSLYLFSIKLFSFDHNMMLF